MMYNYRLRFLKDVLRVFGLPPALLSAGLRALQMSPSWPVAILLYTLSIPTASALHTLFDSHVKSRDAKRLGAEPIPVVQGKWPGNIDVLFLFIKIFKTGYVGQTILELVERTGSTTFNTRVLWNDQIFTIDENITKYVLATGFNLFDKGDPQKERAENFLGNGIFNRDGDIWKMHRAMTRPFFVKERISDFETLSGHTEQTLGILNKISSSDVPIVDVQDLFARFTLDAASELLFGSALDTLGRTLPVPGVAQMGPKGSTTDDEFGSFAAAFESVQQVIGHRTRVGRNWPLFELLNDSTEEHMKVIREFLSPLIKAAIEKNQQAQKHGIEYGTEQRTLLEHLVANSSDTELIRDELLNILLAGRDTTASLLTFVIYFLALHPEVGDRLREEIAQYGPATYESIKEMKYLRAVLNETLRLFPPVPLNQRNSAESSTVLPASDGRKLYMPAKVPIIYSPIHTQRRKDLWGEDADEFDPDRWIDPERVARLTKNPFAFIPFNAGPRICLGQNFAYNEASFFLCSLLPRFKFELATEYQPEGSLPPPQWKEKSGRFKVEKIWPASAMTLFVKGGLWTRVTRLET